MREMERQEATLKRKAPGDRPQTVAVVIRAQIATIEIC